MPRPRFQRLALAKRRRILEAAARHFAAHGFANASLNKILEEAEISKGAAYYYFDDKADLFTTTVTHFAGELMDDLALSPEALDADNFWPTVTAIYERQFDFFSDRPWAFGAIKAAGRLSPHALQANPSLARLANDVESILREILRRGQEVGAVRSDLPEDLLVHVFMAVDDAMDRWLLENWDSLQQEEVNALARRLLQGLAQFLAPPEGENDD